MEKYGEPAHLKDREERGFGVIGNGKVGDWELGYNSDLDLVFIHDYPVESYTDGKKELDGLRLAQRIMHIFSTRTASGILYELDTRLRPSGASGLLVTTVKAFDEYQRNDAWTWEHQALVRARMIYGDSAIEKAFTHTRSYILSQAREEHLLKKEVVEIREKMWEYVGIKESRALFVKAGSRWYNRCRVSCAIFSFKIRTR